MPLLIAVHQLEGVVEGVLLGIGFILDGTIPDKHETTVAEVGGVADGVRNTKKKGKGRATTNRSGSGSGSAAPQSRKRRENGAAAGKGEEGGKQEDEGGQARGRKKRPVDELWAELNEEVRSFD